MLSEIVQNTHSAEEIRVSHNWGLQTELLEICSRKTLWVIAAGNRHFESIQRHVLLRKFDIKFVLQLDIVMQILK